MSEQWEDIKGAGGFYRVSDQGRVMSLKRDKPRILRQKTVPHGGFNQVGLTIDGKTTYMYVHRLVAEAFVPNPDCLPVVDHINGDNSDNRAENLRWVDYKLNRFGDGRLERRPVVRSDGKEYPSVSDAALDLGIDRTAASFALKSGKTIAGHSIRYVDDDSQRDIAESDKKAKKTSKIVDFDYDAFRRAMIAAGVNCTQMSERTGIKVGMLRGIRRGRIKPTEEVARRLAAELGMTVEDFTRKDAP